MPDWLYFWLLRRGVRVYRVRIWWRHCFRACPSCTFRRHPIDFYDAELSVWRCRCGFRVERALARLFEGTWGAPDA